MKKNETIKQLESDFLWNMKKNILIFSFSEEFIKRFTYILNKQFAFSVYSLKNLDSFLIQLYFEKYQIIYLDIDLIFSNFNEILINIENGKNKKTEIYLVSSKENSSKLEEFDLPKNVVLRFLDGEEILDKEGKKCIY
jgi:hypothetical protein